MENLSKEKILVTSLLLGAGVAWFLTYSYYGQLFINAESCLESIQRTADINLRASSATYDDLSSALYQIQEESESCLAE